MLCPQSCTRFSAQRVLLGSVPFFLCQDLANFQTKNQILGLYTVSTRAYKSEVVIKIHLNLGGGVGYLPYCVHLLLDTQLLFSPLWLLPLQLWPWLYPLAPPGAGAHWNAPLQIPQLVTSHQSLTHWRLGSLFTAADNSGCDALNCTVLCQYTIYTVRCVTQTF